MKMGFNYFSADDIVSNMDEISLSKIFKVFGDERYSKKIAREIIKKRKEKNLKIEDLVQIVDSVKKYQKNKKLILRPCWSHFSSILASLFDTFSASIFG